MQDASFSQGDGPLPRAAGMGPPAQLIASTHPCVRFRRVGRADAATLGLTKPRNVLPRFRPSPQAHQQQPAASSAENGPVYFFLLPVECDSDDAAAWPRPPPSHHASSRRCGARKLTRAPGTPALRHVARQQQASFDSSLLRPCGRWPKREKTTIRRLGSRARCKPQSIRDRVASQVGPPFGIVTPLGLPFWRANCSSPSAPGRAPQSGRFLGKRREVNREEIALRCAARVQEPVHIARIDFCRRCGDMTGQ